jgi:chromosome segregation ATPase
MDEETRAAFGRIDHYFELAYALHLEVHADVRALSERVGGLEGRFDRLEARFDALEARFDALEARFDALEARFDALEAEFRSFRDWVTARLADLSRQLREVLKRLDRLERQHDGSAG